MKELKNKVSGGSKKCEFCVHYDYDEDSEAYVCGVSLDEDEMADYLFQTSQDCPYFHFYDEYKSVQKQN